MGAAVPIAEDVFWVGVNDRKTDLFESLWPLPHGVSYNAYLIRDERIVLVDAVKDLFATDLLGRLRSILGPGRGIDDLVINHLEPDHSGSVRILTEVFPEMRIIGNRKTVEFLAHLYQISENVVAVEDGEILDLGARKLRFVHAPMVHWPETMMTYEPSEKILFSGDAFGGFGTLDRGLFDDEEEDLTFYEEETLRYFSNIVGKFSPMVQKALQKIHDLEIQVVAPAHGVVWRKEPRRVIALYDRWSRHEPKRAAVIAYGSMYGNTERMMETLAQALNGEGVEDIRIHDVARTHLSYLVRDVWRAQAVVLGTPTYDVGVFPFMNHLIRLLEDKKLSNRILGMFGSYGWSGGGVKGLRRFAEDVGWEVIEPVVEARFSPKGPDLEGCLELARNVAQRLSG